MAMQKKLTTNDIIRLFASRKKKAKLLVRKWDRDTILIEGSATAFEFLGRFLLAHSQEEDCTRLIYPNGPGSSWFTKDSKLGFYFHRLPCNRHPSGRKNRS